MKNKYRIVEDSYAGYEAQIKRWWWPFWVEIGDPLTNTHLSIDRAEKFIEKHRKVGKVVKYL